MTQTKSLNLFYREVQQFRQPWLWAVLLCASLSALYVGAQPFILKSAIAPESVHNIVLILFGVLFGFGLPLVFYTTKLITEIRYDGLYISFFPLLFSVEKIPLTKIKSYAIIKYRPLRDYGGWGIRYGPKGKAFNVSGDRGVQLELVTGEKILMGSLVPEEIVTAIDRAFEQSNR
jgi:hypothetical protein